MGTNQTYNLLYSKGNHKQNEKTTYSLGENICKWCDQQGLISEIYKQFIQLNNEKNQTIQLKNGQKTWIGIFPKKIYRWPIAQEKRLNIIDHQGNANQNHN